MIYTINDIDVATWGMIPGQAGSGSNIALSGHLDLPARTEKTAHAWGDTNGIEPYVSAAEIFHGGRDIDFHFIMDEPDEEAAYTKLLTFYAYLETMAPNQLLTLACDFGSWQVYVRDEIQVDDLEYGGMKGVIRFREPEPNLSGVLPAPGDLETLEGIDGVDWEALGFTLADLSSAGVIRSSMPGLLNRPKPKSQEVLSYGKEGFQVTKTGAREYTLNAFIQKATYSELKTTISSLYALFVQPGTRVLYLNPSLIRIVYVKDGFQVKNVQVINSAFCTIEIKFTEAGEYKENETYLILTDTLGRHVTNTVGQKILVKI